MNLSHIEQYFAQYLSAIEELNDDNAWVHVGEKTKYKKIINNNSNKEFFIKIDDLKKAFNNYSFKYLELD
jgi:hypothetical protein